MSGVLVPSGGSPSFAQQGSVDWISLSGSTLSFSIEVLSRFSKAGVEMITVAIGQAIFSGYNIPPEGQNQVLKELASASLTPTTLTPALSQWGALINVCAGAVTDSQFPVLVEGFSSLVGFPSKGREIRPLQEPTTATALAGALLELAKVSNGTTRSVTFEGGADCGWIAAVAQWLLGLRVEIFDAASGDCIYSTSSTSGGTESQVIILRSFLSSGASTAVSRRSFIVPSGALSFRLLHETLSEDSTQHFFSKGRSKWTTILQDAFGSSIQDLFTKEVAPKFAEFLCKAFVLQPWCHTGHDVAHPWKDFYSLDPDKKLDGFLSFAIQRLPELESLRRVANEDPKVYENVKAAKYDGKTSWTYFETRNFNFLRKFCHCEDCTTFSRETATRLFGRSLENICLERMASTIFEFLWTLSWLDLHESIKPSSSGLIMMYYSHRHGDSIVRDIRGRIFERGIDISLFSLFTGLTATNQIYPRTLSAAFESGICIHQRTLTSLDITPLQNLRLHVLPGQIHFNERIYTQVFDQGQDSTERLPQPPSSFIGSVGTQPVLRLVVEETISSSQLRAKFFVQKRVLPTNYLGYLSILEKVSDGRWSKPIPPDLYSVGPGRLWRKILFRMYDSRCFHKEVDVLLARPTAPQPVRLWTGECSLARKSLRADPDVGQCIPGDDEWVLLDTNQTGEYTEVVRGTFPFIYYVVSGLDASSRARLTRPGECFLCMTRFSNHKEQRIVFHSFLDDTNATAVELICREASQTPDQAPLNLTPTPPLPAKASLSSGSSVPAKSSRKRKSRK